MQKDSTQLLAEKYILNTYARIPVTLVEGHGVHVKDSTGKTYLDFLSGIACSPLGHAHPEVNKAIQNQVHKILHTSNVYYHPASAELAMMLAENSGLDKVFFCNSGTEANEAAFKLSRKYQWRKGLTHKTKIVSAHHSFHGRTYGAVTATARASMHEGFEPLPPNFVYGYWEDETAFCELIDENTAAVILEPIQGEGGIYVLEKSFLEKVRAQCDEVGALLIFDEVQCGIGRTGELFAWQYFNVKPDIITLAKGLANGLPIGAMCVTETAASGLQPGDHGCTFGGNPVSCEAVLVVLKTLLETNLLSHIKMVSALLFEKLNGLHQKYPQHIKEIRGAGLMIGIDVTCNPVQLLTLCREAGLLANVTSGTVIRLLPPYIITEQDVDLAVEILDGVLGEI